MTLTAAKKRPDLALPFDDTRLSRTTAAVLALIAAATLVRLGFALTIGLGIDESYMVAAGRQLQLSYFDHPPLSWWLAWGAARLFGSEAAVVVRLPFILLFGLSTWLMYRLGALLFGPRAGLWAAAILNLAPVFTISTGSWVLPDGPLVAALLAATLCVTHALFVPGGVPARWWLAAGLAGGLALLAKYHAVFLFAGIGLFLLSQPVHRRWLGRPWPYAALAVAVLMFLPVVVWNAEHGWMSFLFQGGRAAAAELRPWQPLVTLAGQALWLLPWLWLPLTATLIFGLVRGPADARRWFLCCLAVGPIAVFTLVSAWSAGRVLFHWAAPGYLMLFPLLGDVVVRRLDRGKRGIRLWLGGTAVALCIGLALVAAEMRGGWIETIRPGLFGAKDPMAEAIDWTALRSALAVRGLLDRPNLFVTAMRWHDAGKIDYALAGSLPVLCLSEDARQYGLLYAAEDHLGQDSLIIGPRLTLAQVQDIYGASFDSIEPLAPVTIERAGRPVLELSVFLAHGLRAPFGRADAGRFRSSSARTRATTPTPSAHQRAPETPQALMHPGFTYEGL